ncbi:MAG: RNA polymerase sigma factor [Acidimicrobiia bacterium]
MSPAGTSPGASDVERTFREAYGSAVATLVRIFGDITVAEDAVQDAFEIASKKWPADGIPPNPTGWIITTARNRAIDHVRRENRGRELLDEVAYTEMQAGSETLGSAQEMNDDQLSLIFTCCHPALAQEHQIALTLRLVGGLHVDEVADVFLISEAAMTKRLVRAKYKIKSAGVPYQVPTEDELPARLQSVLTVLYLIYTAGLKDLERSALTKDCLRLARSLRTLMPDEPEVSGLVALILLSEARSPARRTGTGQRVLLRDQDRDLWDDSLIDEGQAIVRSCIARNDPGPFQLQAAIQAVHDDAASFDDTDWVQIVSIYDHLYALQPTPVVALNRAIAISEADGPLVALASLDELADALDAYHPYHAARATVLARLERLEDAEAAYLRAEDLAATAEDRSSIAQEREALGVDRQS